MRHGSKTAAVVALAAALSLADASQAWAWGYGAALGQDGMTLDRLVSEVLKPIVQLAGYVLTAFGAYRYFQNRSDDGPAARQALGMLATGGELHDFMIHKAGLGLNDGSSFGRSLNGFMREFAVPGLIALGTLWMINGFYDYFFHSDDAVAAKKGLQAAVSGGVMALMGGAFGTISLVY